MVSIQTRNGLQIRKKNLSYLELKQLVEKLEGLCWLYLVWSTSIIILVLIRMSSEKMNRYIQFLFKQLEEIKEELQRANATIAENASEQKRLNALVLSLTNQLNDSL